jgi:hypothetical protein
MKVLILDVRGDQIEKRRNAHDRVARFAQHRVGNGFEAHVVRAVIDASRCSTA